MNNNIIIQSREKDALISYGNGDYETRLSTPIKIEQGDQLTIKNCFIDQSVANEDHLNIPFDLTLNISNYLYVRDWIDDPTVLRFEDTVTPGNGIYLNNDIYFLSYRADVNGNIQITSVSIVNTNTLSGDWGNFSFTMSYYPPGFYGDDTKKLSHTLDVPTVPGTDPEYVLTGVNINIAGPSTDNINPEFTGLPSGYLISDIGLNVVSPDVYLFPQVFNGSYLLKAGDYSPINLASTISGLLSNNFASRPAREGEIAKSQFLKIGGQILSGYADDKNAQGESLSKSDIFSRIDGAMVNQYVINNDFRFVNPNPPGKNYIFGANELSLEWDADLLRFKFTYIHQPFYDSKGNEAVRYIETSEKIGVAPGVPTFSPVNSTGGICFSDLNATYTDSSGKIQNYDFWENVLGFDLNTLLVKYKHLPTPGLFIPITPNTEPLIRTYTAYEMLNVQRGVNYTSNFLGLDSIIDKLNYDMVIPTLTTTYTTTSTFTYSIEGGRTYNETSPYGYFLLEVNAGFNNQFITENEIKHNIQAIISKYYSQASYTTGSEADSIVYTHLSDSPIYLNTIKIRVLNADGTLATDIGPDSTVFLKLVKNIANLKPFKEIKK